ncbi:hypothetical protein NQ317_014916 [Molorchus minor]|uniref:Uncharacterized protein n=1 Tax=Molorchus minor TaxID=1323400 RepID=A0ABQ9JBB8_9CUCU|nr:hypothetical protein NQ317_014916 [Molorchus minor]
MFSNDIESASMFASSIETPYNTSDFDQLTSVCSNSYPPADMLVCGFVAWRQLAVRATSAEEESFSKKPEVRSAWIKFLNRPEESHFQESDLDKSAFKVILKHNAVPSIYVDRYKYERITKSQKASSEPDSTVITDGLPTTVQRELILPSTSTCSMDTSHKRQISLLRTTPIRPQPVDPPKK